VPVLVDAPGGGPVNVPFATVDVGARRTNDTVGRRRV
jgi:hypothetical protein